MDKTIPTPTFDPSIHQVTKMVGFLPGELLTLTIRANSIGCVFICKMVSADPDVEVKHSEK